jgi:dephospho-CoA kinase
VLRVGLTGGIASGKSQVLARFAAAGAFTLDLDRVAHDSMVPGGPAYADVVDAFGPSVLADDGGIDRRRLGAVVFADAAARERLNALVHPRVRAAERHALQAAAARGENLCVSDAALLVETGGHLRYDRLVVVWCSETEQLRRLMERDGIDEETGRARVAAQMPGALKRRFAHMEIATEGPIEETLEGAEAVAAELVALSRTPPGAAPLQPQRAEALLAALPAEGPRGLTPRLLLEHLSERTHLDMKALAALLRPPVSGPWYEAARAGQEGPGPEALAVPLALFCLARHGLDAEFLAAAAASLARLTHRESAAVATSIAAAVEAPAALLGEAAWSDARGLAERWAGVAPAAFRPIEPVPGAPALDTGLRKAVGRFF